MFALLGLSIISLGVILERVLAWRNLDGDGLVNQVVERGKEAWDLGSEGMEEAMSLEANHGLDAMENHLPILTAIAQSAPLLGLLGTVTGMIEAFRQIEARQGAVEAALLAGGIWEALLTTAFGLIVAIPTLFAQHWFQARLEGLTRRVRREADRLLHSRRSSRK